MSAINPPVSEDTRRVMQVMAEENLELRERAEAAERDRDRALADADARYQDALAAVVGARDRAYAERDRALDALRETVNMLEYEREYHACEGGASAFQIEQARAVLAVQEQARTPQPTEKP